MCYGGKRLEIIIGQVMYQEITTSHDQPNLYQQLVTVGCTTKNLPTPLSKVKG